MKTSKNAVRLGIDLGKNTFHVFGVDERGEQVVKRKLRRGQLLGFLANLPPTRIGMEACSGAHHWAREIEPLGHEVRLMAVQFVKPYVKGNKNDYNDAEAICEAVSRPGMRFVTVKSVEQQDMQALHRIRQGAVRARTALGNQIRGLLAEYGIVVAQQLGQLRRAIPQILEDAENGLTDFFRALLAQQYEQLVEWDRRIEGYDHQIESLFRSHEACGRIAAVEGVGAVGATALVAAFGDARQFASGRQFAAALGLVPRQHSTGGKSRLLGISKRGDRYIRTLLVHGARAVVQAVLAKDKTDARSLWIKRLVADRGKNRATVALANKNARIIWALLTRGETYRVAA
jgi:transposase